MPSAAGLGLPSRHTPPQTAGSAEHAVVDEGGGAAETTRTKSGLRRPRRDAHQRSVPPANPRPAANSSAVLPLARHADTRFAHVSALAMDGKIPRLDHPATTVLMQRVP
jgi:hypothetical protein